MPKKNEFKVTPAVKAKYLDLLGATGLKQKSSRLCGIDPATMVQHVKADPEFAEAVEQAMTDYREQLEAEIHRRGVEGIKTPVFWQGMHVADKLEYSDRMLELHAKRHIPEYRDKHSIDHTVKGGVLVVPSLAGSSKEWEDEEHGGSATDAKDG